MSYPLHITWLHSPADIIRQLLVDTGLGNSYTSKIWPVFVSQEPDTPDNCITVYDTTGTTQGRAQVTGEVFERAGFQIRVRAINHLTAFTKARSIAINMEQNDVVYDASVTIDTETYIVHSISRSSGPINLGEDVPGSKRFSFTINCTTTIRRSV